MKAVLTSDGFIQIRYDSNAGEVKPKKDTVIDVQDHFNRGSYRLAVEEGTEALDMATGKIYLMHKLDWGEF